jgi:sugar lactone lactonase YvrE
MNKPLLPVIFLMIFSAFLVGTGCKKTTPTTNSAPSLTTTDVILDVTSTTAQSGGTITSVGTATLSANGICYSTTNHTPTTADTKTTDPLITTSYTFVSNLSGLTPSTTYYLRAYATNEFGTSYGSVITFTTTSDIASVTGAVSTFAGSATAGYLDGNGTGAQFNIPGGVAVDALGNIYVSDTFNNRIRMITQAGVVTTIAGDGTAGYADGPAGSAEFYAPQGLTVDANGNVFVADYGNNVIRKISTAGVVSTYAGNTTAGYVDSTATHAEFSGPAGLAFDKTGNLYVAEHNNNTIRKISPAGLVRLFAGQPTPGYANATVNISTGVFGSFRNPSGIAIDANGNLFVADGNNAIREITPAGVITTVAGGPVQASLLGYPVGIAIDKNGNFFITDESGRVIELTSSRVLYVLGGAPNVMGFNDGTGPAAQFNTPQGIAVDQQGNIYVADSNNNCIRKVLVVATN